jgi:hypothetical protein
MAWSEEKSEIPDKFEEAYNTGWQLYFDNDISFSDAKDRNYTGGVALTLTGKGAADYRLSLDPWLNRLVRIIGFDRAVATDQGINRHAMEFGITLFTPDDITAQDPIEDDHPYANMLFMANSQSRVYPERGLICQSTLLLGILGTDMGEEVQKSLLQHRGPISFDRDQLEPVILNGWLGITHTFSIGMSISFVMRKQNNKIKDNGRDNPPEPSVATPDNVSRMPPGLPNRLKQIPLPARLRGVLIATQSPYAPFCRG